MNLDHLTEQASNERQMRRQADTALATGKITKAEYDYFLAKELGHEPIEQQRTTHEYAKIESLRERRQKTGKKFAITGVMLAILFSLAWLNMPAGDGLTGYATMEPVGEAVVDINQIFTSNTSTQLNMSNITSLLVSGRLSDGRGELWLNIGEEHRLVWKGSAVAKASVTTDLESYALNSSVNVTVTPAEASYTLWLTDEAGEKRVVDDLFVTTEPGQFVLDALLNDSGNISKVSTTFIVRNETNSSNDIPRGEASESLRFTEACEESCELNSTGNATLTLQILLSEGAQLEITQLQTTTPRKNNRPEQVETMPDLVVNETENITLDLATYFEDPDNDTLTYDYMNAPGVEMNIEGSTLTITGLVDMESESLIYVSDLYSLIQSNTFTITITNKDSEPNVTTNTSNVSSNTSTTVSVNMSTNLTNTSNSTTNESNNQSVAPAVAGTCDDPNINLRPAACFTGVEEQAFAELVAPLRDKEQQVVGRFTRYGNLVISGIIHEEVEGEPASNDFSIGQHVTKDFEEQFIPTAWIDSNGGSLYLKGKLYQEEGNLVAPQYDTYIIQNKNGLILAYFDEKTGDLYLRGNIVQLGEI